MFEEMRLELSAKGEQLQWRRVGRYASRGRTRLDWQMYKLEGRRVQTNAYDVHGL
jgi:hypothetical protein